MSRSEVLIDAGNLVSGGGLQVGLSFLSELAQALDEPDFCAKFPWTSSLDVEVSRELRAALDGSVAEHLSLVSGRRYGGVRRGRHAVVFTVFGPRYGRRRGRRHIMGFADVTSLFREDKAPQAPSLRIAMRARLSRLSFRRADVVIVEAPFLIDKLHRSWGLSRCKITVIPNTVNRVFREPQSIVEGRRAIGRNEWRLLYVAAGYPHKNHEFLPHLASVLHNQHGVDVRFQLTLTSDEWAACSFGLKEVSENLGRIAVADLPAVYRAADAVIFPSLMECFSATPLEAMATGTPLLSSDRAFVRDIAGASACYFDPTDPVRAARSIADFLFDPRAVGEAVRCGQEIVATWPTARDRMQAYMESIDAELQWDENA